jgi:serine/threonine protein kinase
MHPINAEPDDATERLAPATSTDAGADLAPGTQVGVYVIRGKLGEGGMGRVHLAEQMRPVQRKVALKLIREQVASRSRVPTSTSNARRSRRCSTRRSRACTTPARPTTAILISRWRSSKAHR